MYFHLINNFSQVQLDGVVIDTEQCQIGIYSDPIDYYLSGGIISNRCVKVNAFKHLSINLLRINVATTLNIVLDVPLKRGVICGIEKSLGNLLDGNQVQEKY